MKMNKDPAVYSIFSLPRCYLVAPLLFSPPLSFSKEVSSGSIANEEEMTLPTLPSLVALPLHSTPAPACRGSSQILAG